MGSYSFRWEHPAEEVFVTGTFDNWAKSTKLDKKDLVHEKTVALPHTGEKILYKFVADGEWKHDHTAKSETDHEGNVNNVLYPEDIKPPNSAASMISSVAPGATTTSMAGAQPLEKSTSPPGAFPETPAANDDQAFSVNPIPASSGAGNPVSLPAGERVPEPSTFTNNTVTSQVHDDPELKSNDKEQTFGVAPIPATGGIGNPVQLQPGEKVPDASTITGNTINSNVKLDKESYEKSDTGAPVLPAPLSPQSEREAQGASIFGLGPQTSNMIPESSMGMGKDVPAAMEDTGPTISSAAPGSTTSQLAGQVPLEPRGVPEVVEESQEKAGVDPEASANPEALKEKDQVENELQSKVPEAPATSESSGGYAGMAAGGLAAAGAAAAGNAYALRNKATESTGKDPVSYLPESVQNSINNMNTSQAKAPVAAESAPAAPAAPAALNEASIPAQTAVGGPVEVPADEFDHTRDVVDSVPQEVVASQKEANFDPEASASPVAVQEKERVEEELLSKVPESQASGEPAPTTSAALSSTAPTASTEKSATGAPQLSDPVAGGLAPLSMDDKPLDSSSTGLNAPASAPAQTPAEKVNSLAAQATPAPERSRDVSPMTKTTQDQPIVTTGVAEAKAPTESRPTEPTGGAPVGTPRRPQAENAGKRGSFIDRLKGTPDSQKSVDSTAGGSTGGKKKGFFGKLKEKLNK